MGTTNMGLTADSFDVTSANYAVTIGAVTDGFQTITPKAVTVNVTGNNATNVYDTTEHSATGFTTDAPAGVTVALKDGASATAARTDVGTTNMGLTAASFDVTSSNYDVTLGTVTDGYQTITPAAVTVNVTGNNATNVYDTTEHSATGFTTDAPAGVTVALKDGASATAARTDVGTTNMGLTAASFDVTSSNYDVTLGTVTDGYQTITPAAVTVNVTGNNATNVYDTTEHSATGFTTDAPAGVTVALKDGASATAARTDVGTTNMGLTAASFDVTSSNYDVTLGTVTDGYQTITPAAVTVNVTGNNATNVYDTTEHSATGFTTDAPAGVTVALKDGASATAARTDVGTTNMGLTAASFDVTSSNYDVTLGTVTDGYQTITPAAVTVNVTGNNATNVYDTTEHSATGFTTDAPAGVTVALKDGASATAARTDVGTTNMGLTAASFDVTSSNYDVTLGTVTDGYQTITPMSMTTIKTITSTPANGNSYVAGEIVTFNIAITDTGTGALTDVHVVDALTGLDTTIASIAVGETANVATSYTVTQADVDKGGLANVATVTPANPGVDPQTP
ncbi:MAG: hypothetical protein LKE37_07450 [Atopobiaceae bacterium]|nr:hypothetical protein [Atopobiaceae bacterium]